MRGGEMPRDILRHVGREPAVALPHDEVRAVGGVHHVDRVDVARFLLPDALEHALGAGALDAHRDAGEFRLERLGEALRHRQVHRGVEGELAFLSCRLDQRWRDRFGGRRRRRRPRRECGAGRKRGGAQGRCGGTASRHTLKILLYRALISSLVFSTAAASSFISLIADERRAAGLVLRLRMHRAQPAGIDDELLCLGREREALEQPPGVRVRRILEQAVRPDDQRRAFGGVDRLHRPGRSP